MELFASKILEIKNIRKNQKISKIQFLLSIDISYFYIQSYIIVYMNMYVYIFPRRLADATPHKSQSPALVQCVTSQCVILAIAAGKVSAMCHKGSFSHAKSLLSLVSFFLFPINEFFPSLEGGGNEIGRFWGELGMNLDDVGMIWREHVIINEISRAEGAQRK